MLKSILIWSSVAIVVLVGGALAYASTKPDVFRLQRSAVIDAPPQAVFPLLNDFRNWTVWSPWEKKDLEAGLAAIKAVAEKK